MDDYELARAAARANAENLIDTFRDDYFRDTAGWKLERDDQNFLALIARRRISGRGLLSNEHVHRCAQYAMIDAALDAHRNHSGRQWLWITVCWDGGITWEREPRLDVISLRRIVYGHLARCGLHGFGVLEFDTWKNLTGERGRRIVGHAHFLGYPADGLHVDAKALGCDLSARRALFNSLGDDFASADVQVVGATPGDFARIGRYMFKRPAFAKMYVPEREHNAEKTVPVGQARGSVARLVDIFSRLEVNDVMFSIGGGREIGEHVRREIADQIRDRAGASPAPTRDEVDRHWRRIRLTSGSRQFREPAIITRKENRQRKYD